MNKAILASAIATAFAVAAPGVFAGTAESFVEAPTILAAAPSAEATGAPLAAPARRAHRSASERVEARIAYIRTALKVTDAQSSQFDTFANVLRKHATDMDQRIQARRAAMAQPGAQPPAMRHEMRNVSAIERLERQQQRMTQRSARLGEVIAAAKPLYATFSPEQKQVADEMLSRRGGRGGHHGGHRGGHRGHHGA